MGTTAKLAAKPVAAAKKTTPAGKKAAPAKKAAAPAKKTTIPSQSAAEIIEEAIAAAGAPPPPGTAPMEFLGRTMHVLRPDQGQLALIIDAAEWMTRARAQLKKLVEIPAGAGDDHPAVLAAVKATERGHRHVARLQRIIASLFADDEDWEWICDELADKKITWQVIADLPALIIKSHNDADQMELDNREARRAAARGRRV